MNARNPRDGWFHGSDPWDTDVPANDDPGADGEPSSEGYAAGARAIRDSRSDHPRDWPRVAVEEGYAADEESYYDRLHEVTVRATRAAVREREEADDQQLIHAVRALEDCQRTANELLERFGEWAGSLDADVSVSISDAREWAAREPETLLEQRLSSLAARILALEEEAESLRTFVDQSAPTVAPNLSALAGPVLAARLIALAGGLAELARKPAGTVQVLGAEDALFAHLRGGAPSPKHGVIYTHDAVRETAPDQRGSAARALAGKLTIAARVDQYSGQRRPELDADLADRLERIRAREDS